MKVRSRASSSNLFLIELIIAILFFSVASAVCVQIFVKSHQLSNDSAALSTAVDACSAAAEIVTTSDSLKDAKSGISKAWPEAENRNGNISVFFNKDLETCKSDADAEYVMSISLSNDANILSSDIEMNKVADDKSVYSLKARHYLQKGGGDE